MSTFATHRLRRLLIAVLALCVVTGLSPEDQPSVTVYYVPCAAKQVAELSILPIHAKLSSARNVHGMFIDGAWQFTYHADPLTTVSVMISESGSVYCGAEAWVITPEAGERSVKVLGNGYVALKSATSRLTGRLPFPQAIIGARSIGKDCRDKPDVIIEALQDAQHYYFDRFSGYCLQLVLLNDDRRFVRPIKNVFVPAGTLTQADLSLKDLKDGRAEPVSDVRPPQT